MTYLKIHCTFSSFDFPQFKSFQGIVSLFSSQKCITIIGQIAQKICVHFQGGLVREWGKLEKKKEDPSKGVIWAKCLTEKCLSQIIEGERVSRISTKLKQGELNFHTVILVRQARLRIPLVEIYTPRYFRFSTCSVKNAPAA